MSSAYFVAMYRTAQGQYLALYHRGWDAAQTLRGIVVFETVEAVDAVSIALHGGQRFACRQSDFVKKRYQPAA